MCHRALLFFFEGKHCLAYQCIACGSKAALVLLKLISFGMCGQFVCGSNGLVLTSSSAAMKYGSWIVSCIFSVQMMPLFSLLAMSTFKDDVPQWQSEVGPVLLFLPVALVGGTWWGYVWL